MFGLIRRLAEKGVGLVYVSHRLDEIAGLVDRVTVLRDGRSLGTFSASSLGRGQVVSLITGREMPTERPRRSGSTRPAQPLLEVKGLGRPGEFDDVSFDVRPGEIVVLTGLVGAGRTEVLQTIFAARHAHAGSVVLNGKVSRPRSVRDAMRSGIALIPEDRRGQGLCVILPIYENIAMTILRRFVGVFGLSTRREIAHARRLIGELSIKTRGPAVEAGALSGGNQQKVVLAKWLSTEASLFLFDEPTQGVDVGSKTEIYAIIEKLAADGKAVLVASSDLEEVIGLADRVIAMHQGRIVTEFQNTDLKPSVIMDAITHGSVR